MKRKFLAALLSVAVAATSMPAGAVPVLAAEDSEDDFFQSEEAFEETDDLGFSDAETFEEESTEESYAEDETEYDFEDGTESENAEDSTIQSLKAEDVQISVQDLTWKDEITIPVTVTYTDGSTEIVDQWHEAYDQDRGIYCLGAETESGETLYCYAKSGDTILDLQLRSLSEMPSELTMYLQNQDQTLPETVFHCSISRPETAAVLTDAAEESYYLEAGEAKCFRLQADQDGSYEVFVNTGEDGMGASMFLSVDASGKISSEPGTENFYGGWNPSKYLHAGEEVYLVLQAHSDSACEGTVKLNRQKLVQDHNTEVGERYTFRDALNGFERLFTTEVIMDDGTVKSVKGPDTSSTYLSDEEGNEIPAWYVDADGTQVYYVWKHNGAYIDVWGDQAEIPYGESIIQVVTRDDYVNENDTWKQNTIKKEYPIYIEAPQEGAQPAENGTGFYLEAGEAKTYQFTVEKTGNYLIDTYDANGRSGLATYDLYQADAEKQCGKVLQKEQWQGTSHLEAGVTYYLALKNGYDQPQEGKIALREKKRVTGIDFAGEISTSAGAFYEGLRTIPVEITYEDGSTETLQNWYNTSYEEVGDEVSVLEGSTQEGENIRIFLKKDGAFTDLEGDLSNGKDLLLGDLTLIVQISGIDDMERGSYGLLAEGSKEIRLEADAKSLELNERTACPMSPDQCGIFKFTAQETGSYQILFDGYRGGKLYTCSENNDRLIYQTSREGQGSISYHMEAGDTCYILSEAYEEEEESYGICVKKKTEVQSFSLQAKETYDATDFQNGLAETPCTVTYADGSSEKVTDWTESNAWMEENEEEVSVTKYTANLRNGDVLQVWLEWEDGTLVHSFDMDAFRHQYPVGRMKMAASVSGAVQTIRTESFDCVLPDSTGTLLADENDVDVTLPKEENLVYDFKPETTGTYIFRHDLPVKTKIFELDGIWLKQLVCDDQENLAFQAEAGKEYKIVLLKTGNETEGSLILNQQKEIDHMEWIESGDEETLEIPVMNAPEWMQKQAVKVSYKDGTSEIIRKWIEQFGFEENEDESYEYRYLRAVTENGDELNAAMYQEEKLVSIPDNTNDILYGSFTLKLTDQKGQEASREIFINWDPTDYAALNLDQKLEVQLAEKAQESYVITVDESGNYSIANHVRAAECFFYQVDEQEKKIRHRSRGYGLDVYLKAGEKYVLSLVNQGGEDEELEGTVSLIKTKKVASIAIDQTQLKLKDLYHQLNTLPVTLTYEDQTTETVQKWSTSQVWTGRDYKYVLYGRTEAGKVIYIALKNSEDHEDWMEKLSGVYGDITVEDIPVGQIEAQIFYDDIPDEDAKPWTQTVTISIPQADGTAALEDEELFDFKEPQKLWYELTGLTADKTVQLRYETSQYDDEKLLYIYTYREAEQSASCQVVTVSGNVQQTFVPEAGAKYYVEISGEAQETASMYLTEGVRISSAEIVSEPEVTSYIEGVRKNEDDSLMVSCKGMTVRLNYADGTSELVKLSEYGNGRSSRGDWIYAELLPMKNGKPYFSGEEYVDSSKVQAGSYAMAVRLNGELKTDEEGQILYVPIEVSKRETVAGQNHFRDDKLTLQKPDRVFIGAEYTARETGKYRFAANVNSTFRIFHDGETISSDVHSTQNNCEVDLTEGETYQVFVRPGALCREFTVNVQKLEETAAPGEQAKIKEIKLVPADNEKTVYYEGLENVSWKIEVYYEGVEEKITLGADMPDRYGNQFSIVSVGDSGYQAVGTQDKNVKSDVVKIEWKKLNRAEITEVTAETAFDVKKSEDYQFYCFTPKENGWYSLRIQNAAYDICRMSDLQPITVNYDTPQVYLEKDAEYLLFVQKCGFDQQAVMEQTIGTAAKAETEQKIQLAPGESVSYRYIAEEDTDYAFTGIPKVGSEFNGAVRMAVGCESYSRTRYITENEETILYESEKGENYLITFENNTDDTVEMQFEVQKKPALKEIRVTPKKADYRIPAGLLGFPRILNELVTVEMVYDNGKVFEASADRPDRFENYLNSSWLLTASGKAAAVGFKTEALRSNGVYVPVLSDLSELTQLKMGWNTLEADALGLRYGVFTPEETGYYSLGIGKDQKAEEYYLYAYDKNGEWINQETSSNQYYLVKGIPYILCIPFEEDRQENNQIRIEQEKLVTGVRLTQKGADVYRNHMGQYYVKAELTYEDGTTFEANSGQMNDPFGNDIRVNLDVRPGGQLVYEFCCGGMKAEGTAKALEANELPVLNSRKPVQIPITDRYANIQTYFYAAFTPEVSGTYNVNYSDIYRAALEPLVMQEINGKTTNIQRFPAQLTAGEQYIVMLRGLLKEQDELTLEVQMINQDGPCAAGHIWDEGMVVKEPTCVEPGERIYTCSVCEESRSEEIPATGEHSWDAGEVTKEATCVEAGERTYTCSVCKETKTEEIPATGEHSWDAGKVTKEATCVEAGERTYTCSVCKETKTEEIPATGEHSWDAGKVTKEATCVEAGERTYTCSVCKETKTEEIPATGEHEWSKWKVTKAPTALAAGKQERTCSVGNHKETKAVAKLKATITLSVKTSSKSPLLMKTGQSTTAVKVSGLAKGDKVKSWKSSNTAVVKVDSKGKLTAQKKTGSAVITVTLASRKTAKVYVKVQKGTVKTTSITAAKTKLSVARKKTVKITASVLPLTSQEKITYKSSNTKVATVSSTGVVTGKAKGTAKITVQSGTKKVVVTVTVK